MPIPQYADVRKDAVECTTSLQQAMVDAGGNCLSVKDLESMSLMAFITEIASQNGIRFHYEEKVRDEKDKKN